MPCKQTVATIWTKGTANWVKWRGTAVAERGPTAMLHWYTVHGAQDLESTMAQGFAKHSFKVLLHRVVEGPLQASRCLVSRTPCVYTQYTRVFWSLTSQQHASVSQGRICSDNFTCCHIEVEVADPTFPVTVYWHQANQSQHWPNNARRLAG